MGILLQVAFKGLSWGTVLVRRDDNGNLLVRELDDNNSAYYRIVNVPPIPLDALNQPGVGVQQADPHQNDYVQISDDVFVDLSCFHPLMYITKLLKYSYRTHKGVEQVELLLTFPRNYADKIERQLELRRGNESGVGQNWIADYIHFDGNNELVIYDIVAIQIVDRDDRETEFKLTLHSRSQADKSRQQRIMQSEDLNCTLKLNNNGTRDFLLGTIKKVNRKGYRS